MIWTTQNYKNIPLGKTDNNKIMRMFIWVMDNGYNGRY